MMDGSPHLARCIEMYDQRRAWFPEEPERETRQRAVDWLARTGGLDYVTAAEWLADALAIRATNKLKVTHESEAIRS